MPSNHWSDFHPPSPGQGLEQTQSTPSHWSERYTGEDSQVEYERNGAQTKAAAHPEENMLSNAAKIKVVGPGQCQGSAGLSGVAGSIGRRYHSRATVGGQRPRTIGPSSGVARPGLARGGGSPLSGLGPRSGGGSPRQLRLEPRDPRATSEAGDALYSSLSNAHQAVAGQRQRRP